MRGSTSQADVAIAVGVRDKQVMRWEHDRCMPGSAELQRLAEFFGVSMDWLMTGVGDGPAAPDSSSPERAAS